MCQSWFYSQILNQANLCRYSDNRNILNQNFSSNYCLKPNFCVFYFSSFLFHQSTTYLDIITPIRCAKNTAKTNSKYPIKTGSKSKRRNAMDPFDQYPHTHTQNKPPPKSLVESPENSDDDEYQSKLYTYDEVDWIEDQNGGRKSITDSLDMCQQMSCNNLCSAQAQTNCSSWDTPPHNYAITSHNESQRKIRTSAVPVSWECSFGARLSYSGRSATNLSHSHSKSTTI